MRPVPTILTACLATFWLSASAEAGDINTLDGLVSDHTTNVIGTSASFNGGTCGDRTGAICDRLDATFTLNVAFDAKTGGERETIWETGGATVGWSINYEAPSTLVLRSSGRGGQGLAVASFQLPPSLLDADDVNIAWTFDVDNGEGLQTTSLIVADRVRDSDTQDLDPDWSGGNGAGFGLPNGSMSGNGANQSIPGVAFTSGVIDLVTGLQLYTDTNWIPADSDGEGEEEEEENGSTSHYFRTQTFRRGDFNADGVVDLSDASALFNFLFLGGPGTGCLNAADCNHDVEIDLSDGVYMLNFLFLGGPPLAAPGVEVCGIDPAERQLSCESYSPCADELPLITHVLNRITFGPTEELLTRIQTREDLLEYIDEQLNPPEAYDQAIHEPDIAAQIDDLEVGYNPDGQSAQGQNGRLKSQLYVDALSSEWQLLHKVTVFLNNHFHTQLQSVRSNFFGRGPVGGSAARPNAEQFAAADADDSGGITEDEWIAFREEYPGVRPWSVFQRVNDADGNPTVLTLDEYTSINVVSYWKYGTAREQFGISAEMERREYEAFRRHAFGSFRNLADLHAKSVAQVIYLNNYENTVLAPNENYSREFLELFLLGADHVYTQRDIEEAAKVFTGWYVGWHLRSIYDDDDILRTRHPEAQRFNLALREDRPLRFAIPTFWSDDLYTWGFHFGHPVRGSEDGHDWGPKDMFLSRYGGVDSLGNPVSPGAAVRIEENTRNRTVNAALNEFDRLLDQTVAFRDCAKFISTKLINLLVTDDISQLSKRYDMPQGLATLFDAADTNGDGAVSREEWDEPTPDLPNGKPPEIFAQLDQDENDEISAREYQEPDLLLDAIDAWQTSDGEIREVLRTILFSDEFLSMKFYRAKVKDPFEFFVSTVRGTGAQLNGNQIVAAASDLIFAGMEMVDYADPTGESEFGFDWMHTVGLLERLKYANRVANPLPSQARGNFDPRESISRWDLANAAETVDFFTLLLHGGDILENHRLLAEEAYNNGGRSTVGRVRTAVAYLLSLPQLQKQ